MSISEIASEFSEQFLSMSAIELVGTITALVYILLATRGFRASFIFGGISSVIFVWIALVTRYYFDAVINVYYILMSVVGWINWKPQNDAGVIQVEFLAQKVFYRWLIIAGLVCILCAFVVDQFSNPALVYLDSFTTVFAFLATWMLVKKYKENWLIWIVVDLVAAGMYYYKEWYFVSALFVLYTFFAIYGYFKWNSIQKSNS